MKTSCTAGFPMCAASSAGLRAELNANGSVRRLDCGGIMLNVFLGSEAEGGPANIYLRRLGASAAAVPLLGPRSSAAYQACERGMAACGAWGGLAFRVRLVLAETAPAWFWHVEVENTGAEEVACDLIYAQDLALADYGAVRLNEYYVCHYVDHTPLEHARAGIAVASRQNLPMGGKHPWALIGSLGKGTSFATDAWQFYGLGARAGLELAALASGLPGRRLQHEHSLVAVQDEPFLLAPGAKVTRGFFGLFRPDHASATSSADAGFVDSALALPEAACPPWPAEAAGSRPAPSLFAAAPALEAEELDASEFRALFGDATRHAEMRGGRLLSFFTGANTHVVTKAKEREVLRPHGQILRSGGALAPDESALTSTVWMGGVFHSMVTQGHVSINRFLSTCHGYLGLFHSHGQRVFVEAGGAWRLLGVPSAFAMSPASCRWFYKWRGGLIEVTSSAAEDKHELRLSLAVLKGGPARFLISHHIAMNGDDGSAPVPARYERRGSSVFVRAAPDSDVGRRFPDGGFDVETAVGTEVEAVGGDELLFADGVSHSQPFLCFVTAPSAAASLVVRGRLLDAPPAPAGGRWTSADAVARVAAPEPSPLASSAERLGEFFPWLVQNALVHYLAPRGLEQYSGGGWGTRDVCQGPVELLRALGRLGPVRGLLGLVFGQQNADGDWPQWFMFFDRERNIRPGDSHGDIVYWPLLALAQYLAATGDAGLLDEPLPFFHPDGAAAAEKASVLQHVDRALGVIRSRVIAGTVLAAYGHGDWNDSLQPAKPDMRERLCSSWTVTLCYQTLTALAAAFRRLGAGGDRAARMQTLAARVLEEFQRVLIVDGVLAGLAYFHEDGKTDYLLHPRDSLTGLSYSLLPMIHAVINGMLSSSQAKAHLDLVREHLLGPDGAHLFDRPMAYHGGVQTYFQRAESASYFGREIGNMYTHAHLRYCEALAHFGDAEGFFRALCQVCPIAVQEIVPAAALRQANCYFSSSDPLFADRYEAFEHYGRVQRGEVALEGGWRIYSSGAGIGVRLIVQAFLGIRQEAGELVVDPVVPLALNGMRASVRVGEYALDVVYHVQALGRGPISLILNGGALPFLRENNPYRPGAARVALKALAGRITNGVNLLSVWIE